MAEESIDPRYDPMYQRGYTPGTAAPARRAAQDTTEAPAPYIPPLSSRAPAAPAAPAGSRTAAPTPGETAAHAELRARAEAAAAGTAAPAPAVEVEAAPRRDLRRNPFLWAVLVIGVLLIVAGIGLLQDLGRQLTDTGTGTATNYLQLQFEMSASPLSIALGIAAILAVLLVYALDWQRRR
jgi:hypothetical protein